MSTYMSTIGVLGKITVDNLDRVLISSIPIDSDQLNRLNQNLYFNVIVKYKHRFPSNM